MTDAIMNGLPPHIAQVICGHKSIDTTMGYTAVYPAETIEAHRAFIARRRSVRPGEEYRMPSDEEWDAFQCRVENARAQLPIDSVLRRPATTGLGMPTFGSMSARTSVL